MLSMVLFVAAVSAAEGPSPQVEAQRFLDVYNGTLLSLYPPVAEAFWAASTDVGPENEARRVTADSIFSAFVGSPGVIDETKRLLAMRASLTPLQVKQLEKILYNASGAPGTAPALVQARVRAEARAAGVQDGFRFCFEPRSADGSCPAPKSANDIDDVLQSETDLSKRLQAWEASKAVGVPLKPELEELRRLRNEIARSMGYSSYFAYMTADYGMSADEMMALLDSISRDIQPLYRALSVWGTHQLAKKYGQAPPPPGAVPAHWLPNRWGQEWGGLVEGVNLDEKFAGRSPEWVVRTAEEFYVSLGFAPLPPSFWEKSDLYPLPAGDPRRKNSHASAWHLDLQQDVRSLMSVKSDANWFFTSHHELGHIYYDLAYARPEVPPVLREGANRAFHEGVGELISVATGQIPYLRGRGILTKKDKINVTQAMLDDALTKTVVFLPWSAGVMSRFEYELYEKNLPPDQWQARWWQLVQESQGIAPPSPARLTDSTACDACTKTHIIDDPAGYYDYALATVIKYQLHEHIAKNILKQDPRACDYYGNKEVGAYLQGILEKGATEDWRKVLKDATGEDLSTRALMEYYAPLQTWLDKENARLAKEAAKGRR